MSSLQARMAARSAGNVAGSAQLNQLFGAPDAPVGPGGTPGAGGRLPDQSPALHTRPSLG